MSNAVGWVKRGGHRVEEASASKRRYPGLQTVAGVLKVSGILVVVWGILSLVGTVNNLGRFGPGWNFNPLDAWGSSVLFQLGSVAIVGIILWAVADLILVILDIEASVRTGRAD